MSEPKFVYVTYIATTPQKLWQALTEGAFTRQYWFGQTIESDWALGSRVVFRSGSEVHDYGEVLECEPCRRLSYSWHVEYHEVFRREKPSRVTFELEPMGNEVKLTVTHDQFEPGSKVRDAVSNGWPLILASLKSLLETGRASPLTSADKLCGARERSRWPQALHKTRNENERAAIRTEDHLRHLHRQHALEGMGGAHQQRVYQAIFLRPQRGDRRKSRWQLCHADAGRPFRHQGTRG